MPLALLAVLLGADAKPEAEAARWFAEGTAAYQAGHFEEARTDFVRSYALVPAQETLFDAAQSERRLGTWRAAKKHYQLYLEGPAEDPSRALAQRYLAEVQGKLGEAPSAATSATRVRLRRIPIGARVLFGIGVSSLAVGGLAMLGGGIILAGDHTVAGTADHSLYGGQVLSANNLGYVGEAGLGVGVAALVGAVIWGALALRGGR